MKNATSRMPIVFARFILLMGVLGLLMQSAQACTLPLQRLVAPSMSGGDLCQAAARHAGMGAKCASGGHFRADKCFVQARAVTSNVRLSSSPEPVAIIVAPQSVPSGKLRQLVGLAAAPPPELRSSIPLSILHCSFQI